MNVRYIPLGEMVGNPNDPREKKDSTGLQESIKTSGLLQPLRGYYSSDLEKYVVIVGNTRLTALRELKKAGIDVPGLDWDKIPFMQDKAPEHEDDALVQAVAANVQKELRPVEIGKALKHLMVSDRVPFLKAVQHFGLTPAQGQDYLALVEAPPAIQTKVNRGEISMSAWKSIKTAPVEVQEAVAEVDGKVTVDKAKRVAAKARENNGQVPSQDLQAIVETDDMKDLQEAIDIVKRIATARCGKDERYNYVIVSHYQWLGAIYHNILDEESVANES